MVQRDGFEIRVYGSSNWESTRAICYEIWKNNEKIKDLTSFHAGGEEPYRFQGIEKENEFILILGRDSRNVTRKSQFEMKYTDFNVGSLLRAVPQILIFLFSGNLHFAPVSPR